MTSVGHCLTGLSLAALAVPRSWERREKVRAFVALTLVAGVPDLPLPFWGHFSYRVSHSLFVNLALVAVVLCLLLGFRSWRGDAGRRWVVAAGAAAWLSHLLLDSLYSHGRGIRIFWPISDAALNLPVPWLHVLQPDSLFNVATLRIFATEAVLYGAILGACLIWRWRWKPASSGEIEAASTDVH
jgi:membrane-bound metal-dependent hydrolase YbcI (DUF457 family)